MANDKSKQNLLHSDDFDEVNAQVLIDLLADPVTSESVRLMVINEILENTKDTSFFEVMLRENMSLSDCPFCSHSNHWLIPEDDLNVMSYISSESDVRVPRHTTSETCETYAESCSKKKTTA